MNNRIPRWTPAVVLLIAGSSYSLAAGPFGSTLELSSLDGTNGFVCTGIDAVDNSGSSVSGAGDVNGDGIDDFIIGAYRASPKGTNLAGESYVVFGGAGVGTGGTLDLSTLNGANGFVCNGNATFDFSGFSVSGAGDINGDGIDDLIIGALFAGPNDSSNGESYVVFGGAGVGANGSLELSSLNGTSGFVCNGVDAYDQSGFSVSDAGDVNGDGIDDLIIGARYADPTGAERAGRSYVVFGSVGIGASGTLELSSLNGTNGFVCNGIDPNDRSGSSVSGAGDVNGDGIDDLIIGALFAGPNDSSNGESYVVFGGAGVGATGVLELSSLNGINGFVCIGADSGDLSGRSVSDAGDINGDGFGDLIIGAHNATGYDSNLPGGISYSAGESYVVFGGTGVGSGGTLELSSLVGLNGFVLKGIDEGDRSGFSVSGAGDVNGDGFDDIIIGASDSYINGFSTGESYVIFGNSDIWSLGSGVLKLSGLNAPGVQGEFGFIINGVNAGDSSGFSVSDAGDVNGDGIDDIIIGALRADPNGYGSGETYVVFGKSAGTTLPADINGDGVVDTADLGILIGSFGMTSP